MKQAITALAATLIVAACAPRGPKLPTPALDQAIGNAVGDPDTCVLIAERATLRVVYSYNAGFNCVRALPACDRPGFLSAKQALAFARLPKGRFASCNSNPEGTRTVGWAEGAVKGSKSDLVYSAVMEGQNSLPGIVMSGRLDDAFSNLPL